MNENELLYGKVIAKLNQAGLGPTDPAIKSVLKKLEKQKDPQKLKKLLEDLLALDINELKDKLDVKRKKIEDREVTTYLDKRGEEIKNNEQNQDLFILTANDNGQRLIDREEQERSLQDRQKAIAERSLRVLEAMEKARDAIQKGKDIPQMDLSYLKDLTPDEFSKQMKVFKDFGLEPVVLGDDGKVREDPEREVTLETITLEDLEEQDIAFAIPFEKLQTKDWREMAEKAKVSCKKQGIESEYEPELERDANNITETTRDNASPSKSSIEIDEGR